MTFGRPAYPWVDDEYTVPIEETLSVLADFVKAGKVRHVGVSNETPWGVAQFLRASGEARLAAHQRQYSRIRTVCLIALTKSGSPSTRIAISYRLARVFAARVRLAVGQV